MTSSSIKEVCIKCVKGGAIATCDGCKQRFCQKHFNEHREELSIKTDLIGQDYDVFKRDLNEEIGEHPLVSHVNNWEKESIKKIQLAAGKARKEVQQYLDENMTQLKTTVSQITEDLLASRESANYTETNINKWAEQLNQLRERLEKLANVDIIDSDQLQPIIRVMKLQEHQTAVQTPTPTQAMARSIEVPVKIDVNDRWIQHGITVAGGYGQGDRFNQLYGPHGLYVDHEKTIYIADYDNHRILEWKPGSTSACVMAGGNGRGNRINRLDNPLDVVVDNETNSLIICDRSNRRVMRCSRQNRANEEIIISNVNCQGLAMDKEGLIYVSDSGKHEVRRYKVGESNGIVVAGGNGKGDHLNQLNFPANIFVDQERSVYVSDSNNHRVVKWKKDSKEGILVAGGQGKGNKLTQLSNPRGVTVDSLGTIYVVDGWNHRVMRWCSGVTEGDVIVGGNGQGQLANQLNYPEGLAFDGVGNLYIADCLNHRIQRFDIQRS